LTYEVILFAGETKPFIRNVFTLNTCSHIVGSQVLSFNDEAKMLQAWRDFVEEVDPDVVIGYNIANFDLPYLIDRAKHLNAKKFPFLGRLKSKSFFCPLTRNADGGICGRHEDSNEGHSFLIESLWTT
jgi:DNA polymerase elongation subunit (family B)